MDQQEILAEINAHYSELGENDKKLVDAVLNQLKRDNLLQSFRDHPGAKMLQEVWGKQIDTINALLQNDRKLLDEQRQRMFDRREMLESWLKLFDDHSTGRDTQLMRVKDYLSNKII